MAFSFGTPANAGPAAAGGAQLGPDLQDVSTAALGFQAIARESKLQLLPSPWPADRLPPSTSSVLSVASRQGLLAAAGPDVVVVASTKAVRQAFSGTETGDGNIKPFAAELKLPMPGRISQVTFTADETYLVLSAENGGGLAVYEVQSLLQGSTQPALEIPTNSVALRALVPNPTPEKGELLAVVTLDGKLLVANLKERNFVQGGNGPVLREGVSCVSWSPKGKQLVAGLGDGTASQMTPEGVVKDTVPKAPGLAPEYFVSSITWLETNIFLVAYTPNSSQSAEAPASNFALITRQTPNFMFQTLTDPAGPFGLNRSPPCHFVSHLREFPPNLQDMIIVTSTASSDVGLFTRSKTPLTQNKPADGITSVFTMTEMENDSRRAQLPMAQDLTDTSPLGMVVDLSATEMVAQPIPGEEINSTSTPLPALMILNNEGVLVAWWIVYNEAVRSNMAYPGLIAANGATSEMQAPSGVKSQQAPAPPAFGQVATSAFGTPAFGAPAFGSSAPAMKKTSVWGTPGAPAQASGPAFGASGFAAASKPTFGTPTAPSLGNRSSPWAAGGTANATPAFGQAASLGKPAAFGAPSTGNDSTPKAGGFGKFATSGGFGAAATNPAGSVFGSANTNTLSPFAIATASTTNNIFGGRASSEKPSVFGQPSSGSTPFGGTSSGTTPFRGTSSGVFGSQAPKPATNPFASTSNSVSTSGTMFGNKSAATASPFGSTGFQLTSSFKPDSNTQSTTGDGDKGISLGDAFGRALLNPVPAEEAQSKDEDMDTTDSVAETQPTQDTSTEQGAASTTPMSTPAGQRAQSTNVAAPNQLFGTTPSQTSTPQKSSGAPTWSFGSTATTSLTTPTPAPPSKVISNTPASPKIKEEPQSDDEPSEATKSTLEPPLPPMSTSRSRFGDSSTSSPSVEPPLPPDPPTEKAKDNTALQTGAGQREVPQEEPVVRYAGDVPPLDVPGSPAEIASGGEDEDSGFLTEEVDGEYSGASDEEGSGEDISKDLSPPSENRTTPGFTPQSSNLGGASLQPDMGSFSKVAKPGTSIPPKKSLFGEIGMMAPVLAPPKAQLSPRSPSPVRNAIPSRMMRPEQSRSVSAPGVASKILETQTLSTRPDGMVKTNFTLSAKDQEAAEKRRAEARAKKDEEERRVLIDEDDERLQEFLASEIEPSKELQEFEALSEYVSPSADDSVASQIESIFRDINCMVDTIGVNAKHLKAFVLGQQDQRESDPSWDDLDANEWCLGQISEVSRRVQTDLTNRLAEVRLHEAGDIRGSSHALLADIGKLRYKQKEVDRLLELLTAGEQQEAIRTRSLSAEDTARQAALRAELHEIQQLMTKTEENVTLLRTRLTSQGASNRAPPTVDAVMRTIAKMTSMAEKRSGDIDMLETQMRKLRFPSVNGGRSREGSPLVQTPQKRGMSVLHESVASSGFRRMYTPEAERSYESGLFRSSSMRESFRSSRASPRRKLGSVTADEKSAVEEKVQKREAIVGKLKTALERVGSRVREMEDE